jgi:hypothetical protein
MLKLATVICESALEPCRQIDRVSIRCRDTISGYRKSHTVYSFEFALTIPDIGFSFR